MQADELDAFLVDDGEILAWLTGYETSLSMDRALVLPADRTPCTILRKLDIAPLLERCPSLEHEAYSDWEDPHRAVAEAMRRHGLDRGRVGFDSRSHALTVDGFGVLRAALPEVEFAAAPGLPWRSRAAKSPREVNRVERAAGIADRTMQAIVERSRPGMTERGAAAIAARRFVEQGADSCYVGPITRGRAGITFTATCTTVRWRAGMSCTSNWRPNSKATPRA